MEEQEDTVVEVREELMVSPAGNSKPTLRTAHFLKPTKGSTFTFEHPSLRHSLPVPPKFDPKNWPLKVRFSGWSNPTLEWKSWVQHFEPRFHSVWKQAGIYEAIMSSTHRISRDDVLIIGLAEKWCPETNSFVFPWGEASVTLEDVIILGGFSVLGSPVFECSVSSRKVEGIERRLIEARRELVRGPDRYASQAKWIQKFMYSGSEIEHEAFLSLWLQRFVFNICRREIRSRVFPMATRLAQGERIALAPAVLASIYKDLALLKGSIFSVTVFDNYEGGDTEVDLWSQLRLVQLWAWERFPVFQPRHNVITSGDPRSGLWNRVRGQKVDTVRMALDLAGESFRWRPYAVALIGWRFPKFYKDKEDWLDMQSSEDLVSFALCLRVSKLVGLDCIECYLPHRVAMQFGLDQDVPHNISWTNGSREDAWRFYMRPFAGTMLYIRPRLFESDVTNRYLEWWKQSMMGPQDVPKEVMDTVVRRKRNLRKRVKLVPLASIGFSAGNNASAPPGSPRESNMVTDVDTLEDVKAAIEMRVHDEQILISKETSRDLAVVDLDYKLLNARSGNHGFDASKDVQPAVGRGVCAEKAVVSNRTSSYLTAADQEKRLSDGGSKNHELDSREDDQPATETELCDEKTAIADDCGIHKIESAKEPVDNNAHANIVIGKSARASAIPTTAEVGKPFDSEETTTGTAGENGRFKFEIPGPELEARIARLERDYAKLKELKFGKIVASKKGCFASLGL